MNGTITVLPHYSEEVALSEGQARHTHLTCAGLYELCADAATFDLQLYIQSV